MDQDGGVDYIYLTEIQGLSTDFKCYLSGYGLFDIGLEGVTDTPMLGIDLDTDGDTDLITLGSNGLTVYSNQIR